MDKFDIDVSRTAIRKKINKTWICTSRIKSKKKNSEIEKAKIELMIKMF